MENTNRDTAQNAAPQKEWQDAEINAANSDSSATSGNEIRRAEGERYGINDYFDERLNAMAVNAEPDEEEEAETEDTEDEDAGDWGHVDPAESNSPFPDSNEPSAPGSAI